MQKFKKALVVTLAALMLVPTGVSIKARPLEEVVTNCELEQEQVVQLGIKSLSGDLLGVIRVQISRIKDLTFLQGIDMESLGLVPNTGVILKLNTDNKETLEKVRKGIEEYNKKYIANLSLDEFFVKKTTKETAKETTKERFQNFQSYLSEKESFETLPEAKGREKNKDTEEDPLEKIGDFKLNEEVTKEISETFKKAFEEKKASEEEYKKIKEKLGSLDLPSIGEIGKIFEDAEKREEEDKKQEEELNKILDFKLNKEIVNKIADIFKEDIRNKELDDYVDKLLPNPIDKDLAESIKNDLLEMRKSFEVEDFLNKISEGLKEIEIEDIKDVEKTIKDLQEKQKEAEKEAEKKEAEFLGKISDFKFQKDEFDYSKMFFDKDSSRDESFVTGKGFNHTAFREQFLKLVNEERASKGLNALTLNESLEKGSDIRSKELAEWGHIRAGENYDIKHARLNGETFRTAFDYLPDYETSKARYLGENLLAYTIVPEKEDYKLNTDEGPIDCNEYLKDHKKIAKDMFETWKNSPGHYKNMMGKDYKTMWVSAWVEEETSNLVPNDKMDLLVGVQILSAKDN